VKSGFPGMLLVFIEICSGLRTYTYGFR